MIKITDRGLAHVIERHTFNDIEKWMGKSKFFDKSEIINLINQAESIPALQQVNNRFARIVDAGRNIGIDRSTGQPTSYYTVITDVNEELVTAFPGWPTQK